MSQQIKKEFVDLTLSDDEEVCIGPRPTLRYEMAEWDGDETGSNYATSVDMAMAFDEGTLNDDPQWWVKIADECGKDIKYDYATRNWTAIPADLKREKGTRVPTYAVKRALSEQQISDVSDVEEQIAEVKPVKRTASGQGPKVMRWCVTWNNPTVEGTFLADKLKANSAIKGFVFQKEKGANGTPHFQMYIEFSKQTYTSGVKAAIGHTVHCIKANGTKEQNIKYCSKDTDRLDGPWVHGTCSAEHKGQQGKRNDLDAFAEAIMNSGGIDDNIEEEYRGMVLRYGKYAKAMVTESKFRKAKARELEWWKEQIAKDEAGQPSDGQQQRELTFYFGPTAVGKTTLVKKTCVKEYGELPFAKDGNTKWWDGYEGEKTVLVDEWRKEFASVECFNQLTNAGVSRIEYKGDYGTLDAEAMFFTSNKHPLDIFDTKWGDARFRAMARRFYKVFWWNDDKELTVLINPHRVAEDEKELAEAKWIHFWKRDRQQEDPFEAVDETKYFTW